MSSTSPSGGCGIAAVVAVAGVISSSVAAGAQPVPVRANASKPNDTNRQSSSGHLKTSIFSSLRLEKERIMSWTG